MIIFQNIFEGPYFVSTGTILMRTHNKFPDGFQVPVPFGWENKKIPVVQFERCLSGAGNLHLRNLSIIKG
jgi:hypothetical protein